MFVALERLLGLAQGCRNMFQVNGRSLLLLRGKRRVLLESRFPRHGIDLRS